MNDNIVKQAQALTERGIVHHRRGDVAAARLYYDQALMVNPADAVAAQNLGSALIQGRHYAAGEALTRRALAAKPEEPNLLLNLGVAFTGRRQYRKAEEVLSRAVAADPANAAGWHNLGLSLHLQGRYAKATHCYREALKLRPDFNMVLSDKAIARLSVDRNFAAAIAEYEARWNILGRGPVMKAAAAAGIPEWRGEDIRGQTLLVSHEQGFGDSIMLWRFIRDLEGIAARVRVAVPAELVRLFATSATRFAEVVDWTDAAATSGVDVFCAMLDVPRWLGLTRNYIASAPYLMSRVPPLSKPLIGICWASGDHGWLLAERRRTVPLDLFMPLAAHPHIQLVSLQKGPARNDIITCGAEGFLRDPMGEVADFYDTAQIVSGLGLVISVDSAVAHLAGALGVPTLMLSPAPRCWRWWRAPTGEPWYDNMRLFMQAENGDWTRAVGEAVAVAVARFPR